jgi:enterochelin esterase-like enzyme
VLKIARIADILISRHLMGPVVLVMPSINQGHHFQECVNGSGAADDTYLATDVPTDVRRRLRVSQVPAEWGIAGYSSGGYCAANLSLRHRSAYGAAAMLDGYYRASDGAAARALGGDPRAMAANSPLQIAQRLPAGTQPLPAFWVTAGTGAHGDYVSAQDFIAALKNLEQVTFVVEKGAGHNFYAWSAALPSMLAWMWQQLAPPALRASFPIAGPPKSVQVPPLLPPRPTATG